MGTNIIWVSRIFTVHGMSEYSRPGEMANGVRGHREHSNTLRVRTGKRLRTLAKKLQITLRRTFQNKHLYKLTHKTERNGHYHYELNVIRTSPRSRSVNGWPFLSQRIVGLGFPWAGHLKSIVRNAGVVSSRNSGTFLTHRGPYSER